MSAEDSSACARLVSLKCAVVEEIHRLPVKRWADRVHSLVEELRRQPDLAATRVLLMDVWIHVGQAAPADGLELTAPAWTLDASVNSTCERFEIELRDLLDRSAAEIAALEHACEIEQLACANLCGLTAVLLARKAGLTIHQLRRIVRQRFEQTPREFISGCRAREARKLIALGWKREAAAVAVGLHHRGNLNAQLRRHVDFRGAAG